MNYRKMLICSAVVAAWVSFYGCAPDPLPFDPAKMRQNSREAAKELTPYPMEPISTQLETTYAPRRPGQLATRPTSLPALAMSLDGLPTIRLSLREVIHRTVNNNMDIRVAGYDPAVDSNRVVEAEAKFDPTFFFNPFYQQQDQQFNTANILNQEYLLNTWGLATGIRQDVESGGTFELRHETNWYHRPFQDFQTGSTTKPSSVDHFYSNNIVGDFKQPLLKNFGVEVNRARITIARNDQRISLLEYRKKLEETLFDTEKAYWQLYQAEQEVLITQRLLKATEETAELLAKRGTQDVTRVHTSQANSALQLRRASLISSVAQVKDLSDQLKRLMSDPEIPVSGSVLVLPSTPPPLTTVAFDPQDQINQSLEHRLELAEQILRIDSSSLITRVAKNNLLPSLQIETTLTANGANRNWEGANDQAFDLRFMTYRFGLEFEVPLGNRQAEAIYQRTLLQRQQSIDAYRSLVDQTSLEVSQALRGVKTAWDLYDANHQAVMATTQTLDAITAREKAEEALTPSFVQLKLDTQLRWADAARAESQATASYALAFATLERAKGTLLRYDNVVMEEDRMDVIARGKVLANIPPYKPVMATTTQPANP